MPRRPSRAQRRIAKRRVGRAVLSYFTAVDTTAPFGTDKLPPQTTSALWQTGSIRRHDGVARLTFTASVPFSVRMRSITR